MDLGAGGENVKRVRTVTFLRKHATGTAPTELHTVHVERGKLFIIINGDNKIKLFNENAKTAKVLQKRHLVLLLS